MLQKWSVALAGLLVVTNGFCAYKLVDRTVTNDHQRIGLEGHRLDKHRLAAITVVLLAGSGADEVEQRLAPLREKHLVQRKGNILYVDDVGLRFKDGKLVGVVFSEDGPNDTVEW